MHFRRIQFKNFKSFKNFSATLTEFNVLVGPNNAGKSTIISSFRLLSEGLKKATTKKPSYLKYYGMDKLGYKIDLTGIPIATENVFHNYDDSEPATITFTLKNNNKLILYFPEINVCHLFIDTEHYSVDTPAKFRKYFDNVSIGFVPVLGPVSRNEHFYQKEAARLALLSSTASRNFRNIWYHYPEGFDEFRALINKTWPTMDIEKPNISSGNEKLELSMFCPEERIPREIFWAGFGFQVWCQMLTFILKSKNDTILLIDEPDIYLHSDLQKQLVAILKNLGLDIIIATHSTEIISEVEPADILIINKAFQSARRIKNHSQLSPIFNSLGSNLNPILTQIAKTKKVLFLEGYDFKIIANFARKLGKNAVANQSDFAIIKSEGFNPSKVENITKGIEIAIGEKLICGVIFDSDFRCEIEKKQILDDLLKFASFAIIHNRKELENYLLVSAAIERTIKSNIENQNKRTDSSVTFSETINDILDQITSELEHEITSQYLEREKPFLIKTCKSIDNTTITSEILKKYSAKWKCIHERVKIVPGKDVLTRLNGYLQEKYKISITPTQIINNMKIDEIDLSIKELIEKINTFKESAAN